MKKLLALLAGCAAMAVASLSMASPDIDIKHHNNSFKGAVKSDIHNANTNKNRNKNANDNYNKNSNTLSNRNSNKASNYANNKAKASNHNYTSTNVDSKAKANADAYNGGNSVNVEGDDYNLPANAVPVSIGGVCTDSAAGQGNNFGLSISRANPVCEQLKMFELYQSLGMEEEAKEALENAKALADIRGFFRGALTVVTLGIL